jgi:N-acetylmuramic acid 6-phosphate (MurNAc-6-P) etherase
MVNLRTKNSKLHERGIVILEKATGRDYAAARKLLAAAGGRVPVALVMTKAGVSRARAIDALEEFSGRVRQAIAVAKTK